MKGKLFTGNFISVHRSYNRQEIILDNRNNPISAVHRPDHYNFCHLDWPRAHHSFQGSFSKVEGLEQVCHGPSVSAEFLFTP